MQRTTSESYVWYVREEAMYVWKEAITIRKTIIKWQFKEEKQQCTPANIQYLVYGLKNKKIYCENNINTLLKLPLLLLNLLLCSYKFQIKHISLTLYGLGCIARKNEYKRIEKISAQVIGELLKYIYTRHGKSVKLTQEIANSLLGIGYLAQVNAIHGKINATYINELLKYLCNKLQRSDKPTRDIANSLLGLGYLAQRDAIDGEINATDINRLLNYLSNNLHRSDRPTQHIANGLLGLGYLAQRDAIDGEINATDIDRLLNYLSNNLHRSDRPTQEIANGLLGLGYLVQKDAIHGKINATYINELLKYLCNKLQRSDKPARDSDKPTRDIANSLLGLGYLAQKDAIDGEINATDINRLLNYLSNNLHRSDRPTQDIANSLLGLGYLAQRDVIHGEINATDIDRLLKYLSNNLHRSDRPTQDIANSLLGLGYLAQRDAIHGKINANDINRLLKYLSNNLHGSDKKPTQVIANSLLGLGYLAQRDAIHGKINATYIDELLNHLCNNLHGLNKSTQEIANSLLSLGYLAQGDAIHGKINATYIDELLKHLCNNLQRSDKPTQVIANSLLGLGYLAQRDAIHGKINATYINELLNHLCNNLHGSDKPTQHIANSLLGLGYLAQRDVIHGKINATYINATYINELLNHLCNNLHGSDKPTQVIANSLLGLIYLEQQKIFNLKTTVQHINKILNNVSFFDVEAKIINQPLIHQLNQVICYCIYILEQDLRYHRRLKSYLDNIIGNNFSPPESSKLHMQIYQKIKQQFSANIIFVEYPDAGFYIDIVLLIPRSQGFYWEDYHRIAIEIQGPVHLQRVMQQRDKRKREILEKMGYEFIYVDFKDLKQAPNAINNQLKELISKKNVEQSIGQKSNSAINIYNSLQQSIIQKFSLEVHSLQPPEKLALEYSIKFITSDILKYCNYYSINLETIPSKISNITGEIQQLKIRAPYNRQYFVNPGIFYKLKSNYTHSKQVLGKVYANKYATQHKSCLQRVYQSKQIVTENVFVEQQPNDSNKLVYNLVCFALQKYFPVHKNNFYLSAVQNKCEAVLCINELLEGNKDKRINLLSLCKLIKNSIYLSCYTYQTYKINCCELWKNFASCIMPLRINGGHKKIFMI